MKENGSLIHTCMVYACVLHFAGEFHRPETLSEWLRGLFSLSEWLRVLISAVNLMYYIAAASASNHLFHVQEI